VEVLGIVENMAGFVTPDGKRYDIFGSGGGERLTQTFAVPLLASIPIDPSIRTGGDAGSPIVTQAESPAGKIFADLAAKLRQIMEAKGEQQVKIVN
jgi:ATP-binding protein involved in chromosome partitioning